jgi:hypothetical protein
MSTISWPARRLALLVGGHFALILLTPLLALLGFHPRWVATGYVTLAAVQSVLLGLWAGLLAHPWQRPPVILVGAAWLAIVSHGDQDAAKNLVVPAIVIFVISLAWRKWFGQIARRDEWPSFSMAGDTQFSLKALTVLTSAVAILLAAVRVIRSLPDRYRSDAVLLGVVCVVVSISTIILVWACLGRGRLRVRVPIALLGVAATGLALPLSMGGPLRYDYFWPIATLLWSAYVSVSLLVVRRCGYRLVSLDYVPPLDEPGPLQAGNFDPG